jgi:hypothetical protein
MAFTDGLDHWQLRGIFLRQGTGLDYSATTEDGQAIHYCLLAAGSRGRGSDAACAWWPAALAPAASVRAGELDLPVMYSRPDRARRGGSGRWR